MNKTLTLLLTLSFVKFCATNSPLENSNHQVESRKITLKLKDDQFIQLEEIKKTNLPPVSITHSNNRTVQEYPKTVSIFNLNNDEKFISYLKENYKNFKINFVITCYLENPDNCFKEINLEYIHNNRVIFTIEVMKNKENQDNFDLKVFFPEPSFFGKLTNYVASCFSLNLSSQSVDDGVSSSEEEKSERLPLLDSSEIKKKQ